jgi:superfamily II DNA or RNA helicase
MRDSGDIGNIVDIEISQYLQEHQDLLGYKVPVNFPVKEVPMEPYIYGLNFFKKEVQIPLEYKANTCAILRSFLSGLVDANGYIEGETYVITIPLADHDATMRAAKDIQFICRALGLRSSICGSNIYITGHENLVMTTPISINVEEDWGEYFGFEITGNRRFLLGDFTVTHNTVMAIYLICQVKLKTLVVVHKDFLLQQWRERIDQFCPGARIGIIKAKEIDVDDKDIVIASLQSLSMKQYDKAVFNGFGFVIIDEVHHTSAEVFSRALRKVCFKYTLGLSATIKRKDGLSKVFMWYLGDVLYSNTKQKTKDNVNIECIYYYDPNPLYSKEVYMMGNKLNISKMLNNICEYDPRIQMVAEKIKDILQKEPARKIIVLSDRRMHLERIGATLHDLGIDSGNYFGGMKPDDLKVSEGKTVILGTFCMVSEGFDCKSLDTLILASPKSDVIQSVGRILREEAKNRRHIPLVVDIIDQFSIFEKQAMKRIQYYKKQKYDILGLQEKKQNNKLEKLEGHCLVSLE